MKTLSKVNHLSFNKRSQCVNDVYWMSPIMWHSEKAKLWKQFKKKKRLVKDLELFEHWSSFECMCLLVHLCKCSPHVCKKDPQLWECHITPMIPTAYKAWPEVSQGQGLVDYRASSTPQRTTLGTLPQSNKVKGQGRTGRKAHTQSIYLESQSQKQHHPGNKHCW